MGRFRRISSCIVLVAFIYGQVFALDWQGMAARSSAGDFPSGGYYGASNAFPLNSLVDVTNPATGKRIRVLIIKALVDTRLLVSLSQEAAVAIGLEPNASISVRAAKVPLPSGFGSDYRDELVQSKDPDLYPAASTTDQGLASAGSDKPAPVEKPADKAVAAATPVETKPVETKPVETKPVETKPVETKPVETKPVETKPVETKPVAAATVTVPETGTEAASGAEKPESALPVSRDQAAGKPTADLPQPPSTPAAKTTPDLAGNTSVVVAPQPARRWVGVKSGMGDLGAAPLAAGSVGEMTKQETPPPLSPSAGTQKAPSSGGGLAQGLGSFSRNKGLLNPGDVSRPEQSIWLANSGAATKTPALKEPKVAKAAPVTGPEAGVNAKPGKTAAPEYVLASPTAPAPRTVTPSPAAVDAGLPYMVGAGMYGRQLADARSRSVVRPLDTMIDETGQVESLGWTQAPKGSSLALDLPEARASAEEFPDGFNPWLAGPGTGTVAAGDLPEALVARDEKPEAGLSYRDWTAVGLDTDLPMAGLAGEDTVDGGFTLRADTPILDAGLAEARLNGEERPEGVVPRTLADTVAFGDDPLREPALPGALTAEGGLAANPDGSAATGDLRDPSLPGALTAEGGLAANPDGSAATGDLRDPSLPGALTAEGGLAANPDGSAATGDLRDPSLPGAVTAEGGLAANPDGSAATGDLRDPSLPGAVTAEGGLAANPDGSAIDGQLADPRYNADSLSGPGAPAGKVAGDLSQPGLPKDSRADKGLAANPDGTAVDGKLADPRYNADSLTGPQAPAGTVAGDLSKPGLPKDSRAEAALAALNADPSKVDGALADPRKVEGGSSLVPPPAGTVGKVPLSPAKDPAAAAQTTPAGKTAGQTQAVDPRVATILEYLDKPGAATPSKGTATLSGTGTLPPALAASLKDYDWARSNLPIEASLKKASYYVQVGSFANPKLASQTIKGLAPGHPVVVVPEAKGGSGLYKVFVGPLNEDEKGIILYWFRSKGYRDAYIREGAPR